MGAAKTNSAQLNLETPRGVPPSPPTSDCEDGGHLFPPLVQRGGRSAKRIGWGSFPRHPILTPISEGMIGSAPAQLNLVTPRGVPPLYPTVGCGGRAARNCFAKYGGWGPPLNFLPGPPKGREPTLGMGLTAATAFHPPIRPREHPDAAPTHHGERARTRAVTGRNDDLKWCLTCPQTSRTKMEPTYALAAAARPMTVRKRCRGTQPLRRLCRRSCRWPGGRI